MYLSFFVRQQVLAAIGELAALVPPAKRPRSTELVGEIRTLVGASDETPRPNPGEKIRNIFSYKRTRQRFLIAHPKNGQRVEIHGWDEICQVLDIREPSLRVMFSRGRGEFEKWIPQVKDTPVTVSRLGLLSPTETRQPHNPKCLDIFCD